MKKKIIYHVDHSDAEILKKLDWKNTKEEQQQAIEYILNHEELNIEYLLPPFLVVCWDNAADALCKLGFERTKHVTYELLEWQQDFFGPGADQIRKLLHTFPNDHFMPYYEKAINNAFENFDEDWLYHLSHFVRTNKISKNDFSDENLYVIVTNQLQQCI